MPLRTFKLLLVSNCFYSGGFDSDDEDDEESLCINMNFDEQNINYFCFSCQKHILNSFSEELCYIIRIDFFAFAVVFLIVTFTKFQLKELFRFVVMYTRKNTSDILLLYVLLIVLSMFITPVLLH